MELATGAPLFPGESDIDQLWLIIKVRLGKNWCNSRRRFRCVLRCNNVQNKTQRHDAVIPRLIYPAPLEPGSQAAVGLTSTAMGDLAGISGAVSSFFPPIRPRVCCKAYSRDNPI